MQSIINLSVRVNPLTRLITLFLCLIFCIPILTSAFTIEISSDNKFKKLYIQEYTGTGSHILSIGSNRIELENYPNAVYLINEKKRNKWDFYGLIWVESDTSNIQIEIDENNQVIFNHKNIYQTECDEIFSSAKNIFMHFNYVPKENKPLEPILAMEAKAIIQNLEVLAEWETLLNLYELSQEKGIDNWSTEILSLYLKEPLDQLYKSETKQLLKVSGLDSLENEIVIRPNGDKYLLIAISGSWCGPCIKGIPKMRGVYDTVNDKILFVSTWNDPNLETFVNNHKDLKQLITWPSLWDPYGITAKSIKTQTYPSYVLFDPQGVEVMRWDGKFPGDLANHL